MFVKESDYVSFLLRLWQSDEAGRPIWRASLESAQTGEKYHFPSVSVLAEYLEREFGRREGEKEEIGPRGAGEYAFLGAKRGARGVKESIFGRYVMTKGISIHIGLNRVDPNHYQDQYGNPWDGALLACEFDARDMQALAQSRGFQTRLLLNEQATADMVIGAITEAAQELQPGDILFLSYSGHGGRVPDCNGEEDDDMDETWCCYDRQLVDDELYGLWSLFRPGVRIFMLSDSCHSGTVAKDVNLQQITAGHGQVRVLPAEIQAGTYLAHRSFYDGIQTGYPPGDLAEVNASLILISACQDNQTAADGARNGLFTGTLLEVWQNGDFHGNLLHFQRSISERMPWYQSPNYFRTGMPSREFEQQRPFTI